MSKKILPVIAAGIMILMLFSVSCSHSDNAIVNSKVSAALLAQVQMRQEQIADPTPDRLADMKALGMNVDNLDIQRIFIHLAQPLTPAQGQELEKMGIVLYLDSWIPPVGNNPTGFLLADMPVEKLAELSRKDYVVSLDTAETQLFPQNNAQPQ